MQSDEPVVSSYGLAKTATLTILIAQEARLGDAQPAHVDGDEGDDRRQQHAEDDEDDLERVRLKEV